MGTERPPSSLSLLADRLQSSSLNDNSDFSLGGGNNSALVTNVAPPNNGFSAGGAFSKLERHQLEGSNPVCSPSVTTTELWLQNHQQVPNFSFSRCPPPSHRHSADIYRNFYECSISTSGNAFIESSEALKTHGGIVLYASV